MKNFFIFLAGFISGIICLFLISFIIAIDSLDNDIIGLSKFDHPGEIMSASSYKVFQVIDGDNALANANSSHDSYYGMVVLFLSNENTHYYDDQIIKAPKGKCIRQIGTYQYTTKGRDHKTVPVVAICDK